MYYFLRIQSKAAALTLTSEGEPIFNYREWACGIGGAAPWEDNASPLTSRMNTGVTFFRSTAGGISMAKHWIESLEICFESDVRGCDDQFSFNRGAEHTRSPIMNHAYDTVRYTAATICALKLNIILVYFRNAETCSGRARTSILERIGGNSLQVGVRQLLLVPRLDSMYHSFDVRRLSALLINRLLPISDFSNGHVYFLQRISENLEVCTSQPSP